MSGHVLLRLDKIEAAAVSVALCELYQRTRDEGGQVVLFDILKRLAELVDESGMYCEEMAELRAKEQGGWT